MERPEPERPHPDQLLEELRRQPGSGARGLHRIYLGMAPGVGKTYAALLELHRLQQEGIDVLVAYVETYGRPKTAALLEGLPILPRKRCEYRGVIVEELDLDALLARHPAVTLVDELAHTNVPGCGKNAKRWQDVLDILDAGITVFSTLNIQHIESLADLVESITGTVVRERVPDWVIEQADEVILIDVTPQELRERLRRGEVYPPERARLALQRFFREGNLTALRELALRAVAQRVEQELQEYMQEHEVEAVWPAADRILVVVESQRYAQQLIRRGWRRAQQAVADLLVLFLEPPGWATTPPEVKQQLEENVQFAEDLGAQVLRVVTDDPVSAILRTAREQNVGTIVIGFRRPPPWRFWERPLAVQLLPHLADVELLVVPLPQEGVRHV